MEDGRCSATGKGWSSPGAAVTKISANLPTFKLWVAKSEQVQMENVRLDSKALIKQHAQSINLQVVVSKIMLMNNATAITEAERLLVKQWFEAEAKVN